MKIDMGVILQNRNKLNTSISTVRGEIRNSKESLQNVFASQALEGEVKEAINAKISHHELPLLTKFEQQLTQMSESYQTALTDFKRIVKETDETAIIHTAYLTQLEEKYLAPQSALDNLSDSTHSIYREIDDILSLAEPSKDVIFQAMEKSKSELTSIQEDLLHFANRDYVSDVLTLLDVPRSEITNLSSHLESNYTNHLALNYYDDTSLIAASTSERDKITSLQSRLNQVTRGQLAISSAKASNPSTLSQGLSQALAASH